MRTAHWTSPVALHFVTEQYRPSQWSRYPIPAGDPGDTRWMSNADEQGSHYSKRHVTSNWCCCSHTLFQSKNSPDRHYIWVLLDNLTVAQLVIMLTAFYITLGHDVAPIGLWFNSGLYHVWFLMNEVTQKQVFLRIIRLPLYNLHSTTAPYSSVITYRGLRWSWPSNTLSHLRLTWYLAGHIGYVLSFKEPEGSLSCSADMATGPVVCKMKQVPHIFQHYFFNIHFNIIILPTPASSVRHFPSRLSDQSFCTNVEAGCTFCDTLVA
jgi:hypothetical protein